MRTKILKYLGIIIILTILVLLYKSSIISEWRHYNNGIRAFNERNYDLAAMEFEKAAALSGEPILKYNWGLSLWTGVIKKMKDLKIATINDEKLTGDNKKELQVRIEKADDVLDQLLHKQNLDKNKRAKLYYARGMLNLLKSDNEMAEKSFLQSIQEDNNFIPSLYEIVKTNSGGDFDPIVQLLMNTAQVKPLEIISNWKPF